MTSIEKSVSTGNVPRQRNDQSRAKVGAGEFYALNQNTSIKQGKNPNIVTTRFSQDPLKLMTKVKQNVVARTSRKKERSTST